MKSYSTFAEIDHDLRILNLQRNIAREQLRLKGLKLQSQWSPAHLFSTFKNNLRTSVMITLTSLFLKKIKALRS